MAKALATAALLAAMAAAVMPATAATVGAPSFQHIQVMNSVTRSQQRSNAAIAHVRNSITATRRAQF